MAFEEEFEIEILNEEAEQIITVANEADYRLEGLVETLVRNRADLARNEYGDCDQISATMLFDGTPGFLYGDAR